MVDSNRGQSASLMNSWLNNGRGRDLYLHLKVHDTNMHVAAARESPLCWSTSCFGCVAGRRRLLTSRSHAPPV